MDIQFNYEYSDEEVRSFPLQDLAVFALQLEQVEDNVEASVTFVDDEQMARLNEEYRGKVGPTDVLSFECDGLDDDGFPDPFAEAFEEEELPFQLGDIVIAPDVAERQAKSFNTTFEGELSLLLVHGLLHLCGYDHIEDEEAEIMKQRERDILLAWGAHQGDDTAVQTLILLEHPHHGRNGEE